MQKYFQSQCTLSSRFLACGDVFHSAQWAMFGVRAESVELKQSKMLIFH